MKKGKKQISKKKEVKKVEGEITNAEIKELEQELKVLDRKDTTYGCPKPPSANRGMELLFYVGSFAVFKNINGVLYQIGLSLELDELVLKKIRVV